MAFIDRETALKIIDNYAKTVTEDGKAIVDAVRDIIAVITPTADVVEVVRCKECKYSEVADDGRLYCFQPAPIKQIVETEEKRFCSYGEREKNDFKE